MPSPVLGAGATLCPYEGGKMLPIYLGVFLLSMATLAFEITLTRFFSVAQWYHFAFMAISIALLGFGASGSFLYIFPKLVEKGLNKLMASLAALFAIGVMGSYLTVNYIPGRSLRYRRNGKLLDRQLHPF